MVTVIYSESPNKRIQLATQLDAQKPATLEYLAEGNANIVYSFKPIANEPLPSGVRYKLLRVRKDKSFIQSTKSQAATFQQEFVPLFRPKHLIEQSLITVDEALVSRLNQELKEHENNEIRQALRHSDRLAVDGYGLLMTDMTARHGEFLFEIKPKWLLQSPDAPNDAIRCRTCALRSQRAHATAEGTVMPKPGGFCPLSLVDDDVEERQRAFKSIIDAQAGDLPESSGMFSMTSSAKSLPPRPSVLHAESPLDAH
jgi:inositol-pentakisphosphate 2-kinase